MGYKISYGSIEKCTEYLDRMIDHEDDEEITWISNNPRRFAYNLFNALKAAEKLEHEIYAKLNSLWRIETDSGTVTVRRKFPVIGLIGNTQATDVFDMIDFIINQDKLNLPLIFPNGARDPESITTLKHWAEENGMKVKVTEKGILIDK